MLILRERERERERERISCCCSLKVRERLNCYSCDQSDCAINGILLSSYCSSTGGSKFHPQPGVEKTLSKIVFNFLHTVAIVDTVLLNTNVHSH